eukprot:sb/3474036/
MVTGLYITLNIPYNGFLVFVVSKMAVPTLPGTTIFQWIEERFYSPSTSAFVNNYLGLLVFVVFPGLNSLLNPWIYYARMRQFRAKVQCAMVSYNPITKIMITIDRVSGTAVAPGEEIRTCGEGTACVSGIEEGRNEEEEEEAV